MNRLKRKLKKVLGQDVQVSQTVSQRMEEAYEQICKEQDKEAYGMHASGGRRMKIAAVAAVAVLVCSAAAGAYGISQNRQDFFQGMFGNETKQSQEAKTVVVGKDEPVEKEPDEKEAQKEPEPADEKEPVKIAEMPETEYMEVDLLEAEELIGDRLMDEPIVKKIGEHTLTIQGFVYDENSAMMYFTLERKGGVTALAYDEYQNAWGTSVQFTDVFAFGTKGVKDALGADNIYVDLEKSTEEKLYCYDYIAFSNAVFDSESDTLFPWLELVLFSEDGADSSEEPKREKINLTDKEPLDMAGMVSKDGGSLGISPISLRIGMGNGLSVDGIEEIRIKYQDGSSYTVKNDRKNILNMGYYLGDLDSSIIVFNRLVNSAKIESVIIDGSRYVFT